MKWENVKEFWKLLSADVCNEITNSVFFNKEYEGIYHKSFLVIRQNWIQTMIHLAPSSMSITLYKRMKACQSVSQMAIQEDTKEILERSRNGVTSPIPLNEHYSNLLLFEQNAEKSIEELIELAVKDGLKIQEILLALHLLEKAYQMNTTDCVTNYLKKRITLYVQEETESLQTVSEWLMEWISDLFLHEKPLLKETFKPCNLHYNHSIHHVSQTPQDSHCRVSVKPSFSSLRHKVWKIVHLL